MVVLVTAVLSVDRAPAPAFVLAGIPYAIPLVVVLLLVLTFLLGRTGFGRHVYAVGGNAEAARRAGINVDPHQGCWSSSSARRWRPSAASWRPPGSGSVTPGSGAGNTLLYAVGAAVIGGTSLFGGRGRVRDAVLGGLVIAIIANGLGLLGTEAYLNFIITGGVLLLAAERRRPGSPAGRGDRPLAPVARRVHTGGRQDRPVRRRAGRARDAEDGAAVLAVVATAAAAPWAPGSSRSGSRCAWTE